MDKNKAQLDEFEAKVKKNWGKLTDDEVREARGSTDELIAKIQKKYAEGRDAISSKIDELRNS
ncbi:MAG: CsbD family protein [Candidatus Wenzhouxiangella sp. M2_3B_020]